MARVSSSSRGSNQGSTSCGASHSTGWVRIPGCCRATRSRPSTMSSAAASSGSAPGARPPTSKSRYGKAGPPARRPKLCWRRRRPVHRLQSPGPGVARARGSGCGRSDPFRRTVRCGSPVAGGVSGGSLVRNEAGGRMVAGCRKRRVRLGRSLPGLVVGHRRGASEILRRSLTGD